MIQKYSTIPHKNSDSFYTKSEEKINFPCLDFQEFQFSKE